MKCNRSVVKLLDTGIAAVGGRAFSGFFPDVPLVVPGGVWREAMSIGIVLVYVGLPVAEVDCRIVL